MTSREEAFKFHWPLLPRELRRLIKTLRRYPTERNTCFIQGYISALSDSGVILQGVHSYASALVNRVVIEDEVELKELVEEAEL